jgi:hypothetical protein
MYVNLDKNTPCIFFHLELPARGLAWVAIEAPGLAMGGVSMLDGQPLPLAAIVAVASQGMGGRSGRPWECRVWQSRRHSRPWEEQVWLTGRRGAGATPANGRHGRRHWRCRSCGRGSRVLISRWGGRRSASCSIYWSWAKGIKVVLCHVYVLKRGKGNFPVQKSEGLPISVNVCTLQWYFMGWSLLVVAIFRCYTTNFPFY